MDHSNRDEHGDEINGTVKGISNDGARLAAWIATAGFLIPGGIAFIYFGISFYR